MNAVCLLLAATIPLRNPFWPIGHIGTREPIVDAPRVKIAAEAPVSDEDTETSITAESISEAAREADDAQTAERRWIKARKSLRIGSILKMSGARTRQAITINGGIYADGDLVSVNHEGYRFTWRVKEVTDSKTLRLIRVRIRECDEEPKGKSK